MGVLGLWRLLDATGKPVPLETLEGKVLAIDISIWIHQVVQGYQDRRGYSIPNAHLIGLFNRICKLMYFKIKPVFVFDGGVPLLKKNTIATRRKLKSIAITKAQKLKNDLINNLIKHTAVKGALDKGNDGGESSAVQQLKDSTTIASTSRLPDMYELPDMINTSQIMDSGDYIDSDEDQLELSPRKQTKWAGNIHTVDVNNEEFKNLPADVRYDILTDLKETRKQNSWGRIHELPSGSNNYSGFQVKRLLKRRHVQESLEAAEKEMGGKTLTLEELDKLLTDQGISTTQHEDTAFRIASDSTTRVIYLKDKPDSQENENSNDSKNSNINKLEDKDSNLNEVLIDSASTHSDNSVAVIDNIYAYDLEDWYSDDSFNETTLNESQILPKSEIPKSVMNPALAYMLENSGFTRDQILKIVEQSKKNKQKSDGTSSHGSSKKRRVSLKKKSKRKKLFDSKSMDSLNIKKEKIDNIDVQHTVESNSDPDDFDEVPEKIIKKESNTNVDTVKTIIVESSESGSDDFVEVKDVPIPELLNSNKTEKEFQIMIKAEEELDDDIFADIFSDINSMTKENLSMKRGRVQACTVENKNIIINDDLSLESKNNEQIMKGQEETKKSLQEEKVNSVISPLFNENPLLKCNMVNVDTDKITSNSENLEDKCVNYNKLSEAEKQEVSQIICIEEKQTEDENLIKNSDAMSIDIVSKNTAQNLDLNLVNEDIQKIPTVEKQPTLSLPTDEKELESLKEQLENEQQEITGTLGKLERQAIDISDQMRLEAQELLRLFGVPYLVAPMEAEAQCAYLEQINLTDGTITDDSDIWLFGGKCVYKNFFDNNKRVLQFLSKDIEHHFKLSRKEMILLALLVGSDYTNGLMGVGPVTALEILAAFPSEGENILRGLQNFSTWFRAGNISAPGKTTLRNKLKSACLKIDKGFPSQAVVQAYMCPMIDESKESFTWGKPNLVLLADYVKKKFGWTKLKFEEIINPVMKKLVESKSQKGIDSYFKVHSVPKSIEATLSKRVQAAIQKMGSQNASFSDDDLNNASTTRGKVKNTRKSRAKKSKNELSVLPIIEETKQEETESQSNEAANEPPIDINCTISPRKLINESDEVIPQREKDKANALKTKLKAIEIFRKSKKGLGRVRKAKKVIKKVKEDAELSESSSSS